MAIIAYYCNYCLVWQLWPNMASVAIAYYCNYGLSLLLLVCIRFIIVPIVLIVLIILMMHTFITVIGFLLL